MSLRCWRHRRSIAALLRGALGPRRFRALRRHAGACTACRDRLDGALEALRALSPRAALAADEVDLIGRAVVDRALARPRRWVWVGATATATAAVVLLLIFVRGGHEAPRAKTDLRPRGGDTGERSPGARIFCVADDDTGRSHVIGDTRATEPALPIPSLRCNLDARLQLAYSTPTREGLTMVAFSRDTQGALFWYAPRRATDFAVSLEPDAMTRSLGWSTRLAVKHTPGSYEVTVLFFDHPVVAAEAAAGRAAPLARLALRLEVTR